MLSGLMIELPLTGWLVTAFCAAMIGFSKTGMPNAGVLVVPLLAMVIPGEARNSVGFLLPILCLADITAVIYWRRHAQWGRLLSLIPWAFVGILVGYVLHRFVFVGQREVWLGPVIGLIVLGLIGVTSWRNSREGTDAQVPTSWWFAAIMGLLAGSTTMLANAAGPIMAIYLLAMRFDKAQFLGTGAWYFFIMNLVKVPFFVERQMITLPSLMGGVVLLPAILAGGILGIVLVHRISARWFNRVVTILASVAAVALLVRGILQLVG